MQTAKAARVHQEIDRAIDRAALSGVGLGRQMESAGAGGVSVQRGEFAVPEPIAGIPAAGVVIMADNGMGNIKASIAGDSGPVLAVLHQIEVLLRSLLKEDEGGSIDLGELPLSNDDLDLLEEALGEGEVYAEVESRGFGEVRETGVSGVWWVTHRNEDGAVIAEFIEINYCPELLVALTEDVQDSWEGLRAQLLESEYLTK